MVFRYYGSVGSLSSVYFWDTDDAGFAGCWLIKKGTAVPLCGPVFHEPALTNSMTDIPDGGRFVKSGCWDSVHLTETKVEEKSYVYKLTTTVMLTMEVVRPDIGTVTLSGNLHRQSQSTAPRTHEESPPHLANLGKMIEAMETDMRNNMDSLYISKVGQCRFCSFLEVHILM